MEPLGRRRYCGSANLLRHLRSWLLRNRVSHYFQQQRTTCGFHHKELRGGILLSLFQTSLPTFRKHILSEGPGTPMRFPALLTVFSWQNFTYTAPRRRIRSSRRRTCTGWPLCGATWMKEHSTCLARGISWRKAARRKTPSSENTRKHSAQSISIISGTILVRKRLPIQSLEPSARL